MIRDVSVNVAYTESTVVTNLVRKDWVLLPFAVLLINWSHQCRMQMSATPSQSQTLQEKNPFVS